MFNMVEHELHPIGDNARLLSEFVVNEFKFSMPPCYDKWVDVLEHLRCCVMAVVEVINLNFTVNLFH